MSTSPVKNLSEFLREIGDTIDRIASQLDALAAMVGTSGNSDCTGLSYLLEDLADRLTDTAAACHAGSEPPRADKSAESKEFTH